MKHEFLLAFNAQGKVPQATLIRISAGRQVYGATFGGDACGFFLPFSDFIFWLWFGCRISESIILSWTLSTN